MKEVKTAVISAAGFSTRFLPTTKTIPKEMIPILDTPTIEYIVEELAQSGIENIIIVTKRGNAATEDYFDNVEELENALLKANKLEYLERVKRVNKLVKRIAFVRQDKTLPYGNATPLICAQPFVKEEPFIYVFCDDLVIGEVPATKELIEYYKNNDVDSVIIVDDVEISEVNKYGIVKFKENNKDIDMIIEKPEISNTPSTLASYGRYIFSPKIFKYLDPTNIGKNGELWIVDAINRFAKENIVQTLKPTGKWYTTGDPLNLFKVTLEIASRKPEYREYLKQFTQSLS